MVADFDSDCRLVGIDIDNASQIADLSRLEADALPITSRVQTWGDEIYFGIPVHAEEADDAQATVDKGAVAYWPPGHALCLFWGPTPTSQGNEIRPASPVNVIGQIVGDATVLARAADGATISVTRA